MTTAHQVEIHPVHRIGARLATPRFKVTCSCGFASPKRLTRPQADRIAADHLNEGSTQ